MKAQIRYAVLMACAAALPSAAFAQAQPAPAPVQAGVLEEIVITAQKRVEKLQDVPVAASVVATDALAKVNAGDITDLNNLVPSVNMNATINGRVPIGMRGISSNANEATVGLASGVAIMIDGVPVPSDSYAGNQLDDIAKVEVLKGPQATLGGRTAAAGVINLVTRGPSAHLTGSAALTLTDDHEYRASGFIAGPISDTVQYSVAAYGNTRDYPITNLATGDKTDQKTYGVRGKLLFKPNENLDITLMGRYAQAKSEGFNFVYTYLTPGAYMLFGTAVPPFPPFLAGVPPTVSQATLMAGVTPSQSNLVYNSPVPNAGADIKDKDASLIIDYRMGDLTLTSTTAYQHETQTNIQDLFAVATYFSNEFRQAFQDGFALIGLTPPYPPGSPPTTSPAVWADFNNTQTQNIDVRQVSEELKLASPTDRDISYLVGFFFSDTKVGLNQTRTFTPAAVDYFTEPDTKTYDLYGRVTWKLAPSTSLVTGLRYNYDRLGYHMNERLYATAPGVPPFGPVTASDSDDSSALVGDISLKYDLSPNSMLYGTYARGYAPRAYNTALPIADSTAPRPVDQEHIDHFELGSKGFYLDHRLSLNVALFDTIYHDYQIQSYSALPGYTAPPLVLSNAAKAETRGIEADLAFAASSTTMLTLNAAYIDAKFKDYKNAPCWGGPGQQTSGCAPDPNGTGQFVQDVSGDPMPNSPKFKAALGLEQRIPLTSTSFDLLVGGTYSYRSSAQMLPDQNPQAVQDAFGLLGLYATLHDKAGRYSVTVFGNNLTDHIYYGDVEDFWTGPWSANAVVAQPARDARRYFGIRFNADF